MKLLDQVYQPDHHQAKTLALKALQHPQVILRHAGYSPFPCLRAGRTNAMVLSEGWVPTMHAAAEAHTGSRAQLPEQDTEVTELCRPSLREPGKLDPAGEGPARRRLCCSETRRNNLSARANVQQSGQMPAREPGERKLSDGEPGKPPRLSSTVGRTKMEMANAKMSGISFLQRNNLY